MSDRDDGGPAFPSGRKHDGYLEHHGMTLRQWYAGMAMQGLFSAQHLWEASPHGRAPGCRPSFMHDESDAEEVAKAAFWFADAMLAHERRERERDGV